MKKVWPEVLIHIAPNLPRTIWCWPTDCSDLIARILMVFNMSIRAHK